MMPITDVFCRVNRARGLELISPEDLLQGCKALRDVKLPMRMRTFDSGVTVLQVSFDILCVLFRPKDFSRRRVCGLHV